MLAALILLLTPVAEPVLLLHARHRAARRPAVRLRGRGGVLAAARRRLRVVARRARGRRRDPGHVPDLRRPARALPARGGGGRGRAAAARPPGRGRVASWPRSSGRAAAEAERARLARDMHDSLAKTVSGIGFAALALSRRIERDPEGAADEARRLADDARQATRQAREIIVGLRAEAGESLPLALRARADRAALGARRPASSCELAIEEVGELHPQTARELEWILGEALANCKRHARATRVAVRLRRLGAPRGADGRRRRRRVRGARTTSRSSPAGATSASAGCASARCSPAATSASSRRRATAACSPSGCRPRSSPRDAPRLPAEPRRRSRRPAPPSDSVPARSVPGYTWQ